MLRKVFPYADHKPYKKPCIYSHIGLCNPCPSVINKQSDPKLRLRLKKEYLKNIRVLKMVLERKSSKVEKMLIKQMRELSDGEFYEEAEVIRDQLRQLTYVTQKPIPSLEFLKNPNLVADLRDKELSELKSLLSRYIPIASLSRIECYDVAHLAGGSPTASMVCFIQGEPEKNYYRRFKIQQALSKSDVHSLEEVAKRRIKHLKDWGKADLVIVDGGKAQVGVFRKYFEKEGIPVVGIAKRFESLVIPIRRYGSNSFKEFRISRGPGLSLLTRIRDEAHRFARKYHHLLIAKAFKSQVS
jgi:excinuclease UvrABC nuclease subunit